MCDGAVKRESVAHAAYERSRSGGLCIGNEESFDFLDSHTRPSEFHLPAPPLVVLGEAGSGKTTLLAHWIMRRRASVELSSSEVILAHYTGCSRESVKLSLFLYRLIQNLKEMFCLKDFICPDRHEEEELRKCFKRALESAVGGRFAGNLGRRRIILVLDGIERIRNKDGIESLDWLPMSIPCGIRVITATGLSSEFAIARSSAQVLRTPMQRDQDGLLMPFPFPPPSSLDSKTLRALRHRGARVLRLASLDEGCCRSIAAAGDGQMPIATATLDAVVNTPGSCNPLYLQLLLSIVCTKDLDNAVKSRAFATHNFKELYRIKLELMRLDLMRQYRDNEKKKGEQPVSSDDGGGGDAADDQRGDDKSIKREEADLLVRFALSLVATSRHGLTVHELNTIIGDQVDQSLKNYLMLLLDRVMLTIDKPPPHQQQQQQQQQQQSSGRLLNFVHDQCRQVVRQDYLCDQQVRIAFHRELANYFAHLTPCQRKIEELNEHLQSCGKWFEVKDVLVDMKMFQQWWTDQNRNDFMEYWDVCNMHLGNHDLVDAYVRAFDDFILKTNPPMDLVYLLVSQVTEFLRNRQNRRAAFSESLPTMVRPPAPRLQDLESFSKMESSIAQSNLQQETDGYHVQRWLWTQFPLLALAVEGGQPPLLAEDEEDNARKAVLDADAADAEAQRLRRTASTESFFADTDIGAPTTAGTAPTTAGSSGRQAVASRRVPFSAGVVPHRAKEILFEHERDPLTPDGMLEFLDTFNANGQRNLNALLDRTKQLQQQLNLLRVQSQGKKRTVAKVREEYRDCAFKVGQSQQRERLHCELQVKVHRAESDLNESQMRNSHYRDIIRVLRYRPGVIRDDDCVAENTKKVKRLAQDIVHGEDFVKRMYDQKDIIYKEMEDFSVTLGGKQQGQAEVIKRMSAKLGQLRADIRGMEARRRLEDAFSPASGGGDSRPPTTTSLSPSRCASRSASRHALQASLAASAYKDDEQESSLASSSHRGGVSAQNSILFGKSPHVRWEEPTHDRPGEVLIAGLPVDMFIARWLEQQVSAARLKEEVAAKENDVETVRAELKRLQSELTSLKHSDAARESEAATAGDPEESDMTTAELTARYSRLCDGAERHGYQTSKNYEAVHELVHKADYGLLHIGCNMLGLDLVSIEAEGAATLPPPSAGSAMSGRATPASSDPGEVAPDANPLLSRSVENIQAIFNRLQSLLEEYDKRVEAAKVSRGDVALLSAAPSAGSGAVEMGSRISSPFHQDVSNVRIQTEDKLGEFASQTPRSVADSDASGEHAVLNRNVRQTLKKNSFRLSEAERRRRLKDEKGKDK